MHKLILIYLDIDQQADGKCLTFEIFSVHLYGGIFRHTVYVEIQCPVVDWYPELVGILCNFCRHL